MLYAPPLPQKHTEYIPKYIFQNRLIRKQACDGWSYVFFWSYWSTLQDFDRCMNKLVEARR